MRGSRHAVLRSVLLLLGGSACAVGPKFVKPEVALNAQWTEKDDPRVAAPSAVDDAWWRAFNDPALDQLIELAYRQNLPLQIAGLRILEARAQLGIAIGEQFPKNFGPIANATGAGIHGPQQDGGRLNLLLGGYMVGFDAAWEPDFWGKQRRGVQAAKATFLATVAAYHDAIVSLSAEIARTYFVIRTYEHLIALARENVTVQEDAQRIAEARFKAGATSELDVAQALNLLESTRASIPELQISLQQAQHALCTLVQRPPGCASSLVPQAQGLPAVPAQIAVSVPAELLRRRPDIRAAELMAIAQCDRIGVATAELFPSLQLSGLIGTRTVATSGAPAGVSSLLGIFGLGSLIYSLGANLFWPILHYPQIFDNIRVQDARFQQSLMDYQQTVLRAVQEVEDGIAGFLRTRDAAAFEERAVAAAETAVKLSLAQYREGAVDFQRVLDAQRSLLLSENRLASTQSSAATGLVALYKALGGGWQLRERDPIVPDAVRAEMQKRTHWGSYFSTSPEPR